MKAFQFSAFVEDMRLDTLPKPVQADVLRFVAAKAHHQFPHYGMVAKELLPKADPANLKTARAQVKKLTAKDAANVVLSATKAATKYILIINDRIVDGHHFLAKAERGGVTSSLNVLDLTPARFQFGASRKPLTGSIVELMRADYPQHQERKTNRSGIRTAAIAAGGAGLAYGGLKIGRAAEQIRVSAKVAQDAAAKVGTAADHAAAITGAMRKTGRVITAPLRLLRKGVKHLTGFQSLRKDTMHFASTFPPKPSVAADRYKKNLHEKDVESAERHYKRSAIAGGALGLALRKTGMSRKVAAGLGAGAGVAAQAVTRAATATTKDRFGDRTPGAKVADKLPAAGLAAGALIASSRRLRRKFSAAKTAMGSAIKRAAAAAPRAAVDTARSLIGFSVGSRIVRTLRKKPVLAGAALAGGITAADIAAALVERQPTGAAKQSVGEAAAHGAKKGLLYGTVLAGTEPLIHKGLVRVVRAKRNFSSHTPLLQFGGRQQLRDAGNRFLDPLAVASGTSTAYQHDGQGGAHPIDLPVGHAQVVRAAFRKGKTLHTIGSRTGSLLKDATDAAAGRTKTDSRGRPQKREWEKSWFKNAAGAALVGAGLLGHAAVMRNNPTYRRKVQGAVRTARQKVNTVVPDTFPMSAKVRFVTRFDVSAPDWDVRDQRGRSARVFAPGSKPRERREKQWHERVENIRKIAAVGIAAGTAGGAILGWKLRSRSLRSNLPRPEVASAKVVPFPVAR